LVGDDVAVYDVNDDKTQPPEHSFSFAMEFPLTAEGSEIPQHRHSSLLSVHTFYEKKRVALAERQCSVGNLLHTSLRDSDNHGWFILALFFIVVCAVCRWLSAPGSATKSSKHVARLDAKRTDKRDWKIPDQLALYITDRRRLIEFPHCVTNRFRAQKARVVKNWTRVTWQFVTSMSLSGRITSAKVGDYTVSPAHGVESSSNGAGRTRKMRGGF
jgi:hypothetical protein